MPDYTSMNKSQINEKLPICNGKINYEQRNVKVYLQRWLILMIFSMNTMVNGCLFMGLSPVTNIVAKYYGVTAVMVEWLSNMFLLVYIFVSLPATYAMFKIGMRTVLIIAASLDAISTCLHFAGVSCKNFYFVFVGQTCAALACGCILQIPGKLSALWFPEHERSTSTSIAVFMNIFGIALGFLQSSLMIRSSSSHTVIQHDLSNFFLVQMIGCGIVALVTGLYFEEEPPTPPATVKQVKTEMKFSKSLKLLAKNKNFFFMLQSYSINYGLFVAVSVLVSPFITTKYANRFTSYIGWMGFGSDLMAILSCFLIGVWLDRCRRYQLVAILLNLFSALIWLAFIAVFFYTDSFVSLFVIFISFGAVGIPYFASGLEQAAEMTYPVSEGTSSSVLLTFANLYGFSFILLLGILIEKRHMHMVAYLILMMYILSTVFSCLSKTKLNRKNAEELTKKSFTKVYTRL